MTAASSAVRYYFCCCLPCRLGVFIIALLGMALGGLIAAGGVLAVNQEAKDGAGKRIKAAYAVHIIVYTLYAVFSLLGFIGAIIKTRRLIRSFFYMLVFIFMFSLASGIYTLVVFFRDTDSNVDICIHSYNGGNEDDIEKTCKATVGLAKGLIVGGTILMWLLQIWGCSIVNDYSKQLEEEEIYKAKNAAFSRA